MSSHRTAEPGVPPSATWSTRLVVPAQPARVNAATSIKYKSYLLDFEAALKPVGLNQFHAFDYFFVGSGTLPSLVKSDTYGWAMH